MQPGGPEKSRDRGIPGVRGSQEKPGQVRTEDVTLGSFRVEGALQMGWGDPLLQAPHHPGVGQLGALRGFRVLGTRVRLSGQSPPGWLWVSCSHGFHPLLLQPGPMPDMGSDAQTIEHMGTWQMQPGREQADEQCRAPQQASAWTGKEAESPVWGPLGSQLW